MKKLFFATSTAILALSACSSGEDSMDSTIIDPGDISNVTFCICLPEEGPMGSGNNPEGSIHKFDLDYAVYDSGNNLVVASNMPGQMHPIQDSDNERLYFMNIPLKKEDTYKVYVWAETEDQTPGGNGNSEAFSSPYTFDAYSRTVSIDYSKMALNNHHMDAFFGKRLCQLDKEMPDEISLTMELERPFAHINILINDKLRADVIQQNKELASIDVEVNQHPGRYTTLNLDNSLASNPLDHHIYHFDYPHGWNDVAVTEEIHDGGEKFHSLAKFFMLTGISPDNAFNTRSGTSIELTDMKITVNYSDGEVSEIEKANIPIQRNCLTNIFGSLETEITVTCKLDTSFYGSNN